MARRPHHHVYVIELSKDVLLEPRFRKNNPGYVEGKPCVYVGMTGLDPDVRFDKHKAGIHDLPPVDVPIRSGSPDSRLLDGCLG